jgi:hypothetical protein
MSFFLGTNASDNFSFRTIKFIVIGEIALFKFSNPN